MRAQRILVLLYGHTLAAPLILVQYLDITGTGKMAIDTA